MNVSREVIDDLLALYFSGEASPGTCSLVEQYFRENPAFAQDARRAAETLQSLGLGEEWSSDNQLEAKALKRAKKLLRLQSLLFALASTFTLNALSLGFSFDLANGHIHAHWLALPGQGVVVCGLMILAVILWLAYVSVRRRVSTRILG